MAPDPAPLPPDDFGRRDLPVETAPAGTTFFRIHRTALEAMHFEVSGGHRFDDPQRGYGVCYAARSVEGAFAETCLRAVGATLVSFAALAERSLTALTTAADLRLVALHGPGLARLGATSAVSSGPYAVSQPWSRAIHDHPAGVDGLVYRSNHDNGELCVALFDRCRRHLQAGSAVGLTADLARLASLLDRYEVGLA